MAGREKKTAVKAAAGKVFVSRHYTRNGKVVEGSEKADQVLLEVQKFDVEPAYVNAKYGLTLNLGNYESARCDAGVSLPCYIEEIVPAFEKAWEIAEDEVQKQVQAVRKEMG